jgi:hypothetical protein
LTLPSAIYLHEWNDLLVRQARLAAITAVKDRRRILEANMYIVETRSNAGMTMVVSFDDKVKAVEYAYSLRRAVRIWHEQEGGTVRRLVDLAVEGLR